MEEVWTMLLISFLSGSTTVIGALLAIFLKGEKNYFSIGFIVGITSFLVLSTFF